jgi:hypothetical protein
VRGALQWRLRDFKYVGVICSFGAVRRGRPLWVFEKLEEPHPDAAALSERAMSELKAHYPDTHEELQRFLEQDAS